jgi:hypothetical protein
MPGANLTKFLLRKALSDMLALKPYRGKPAVQAFRGSDGNVGIIRSPISAIVLLDHQGIYKMKYRTAFMVSLCTVLAFFAQIPFYNAIDLGLFSPPLVVWNSPYTPYVE